MLRRHGIDEREPEPVAGLRARAIEPCEALQHAAAILGRNAGARVGDAQPRASPARSSSTRTVPPAGVYFTALSTRFVSTCASSSRSPKTSTARGASALQRHVPFLGRGLVQLADVAHDRRQVDGRERAAVSAGLDSRDAQQRVERREHLVELHDAVGEILAVRVARRRRRSRADCAAA